MQKSTFILLLIIVLAFSVLHAQENALSSNAAFVVPSQLTLQEQVKAQELDYLFKTLYENNQFNGSILVMNRGKVLIHRSFGFANFEKKDTLTTNVPFRLASVSKQFTAMALMILKEQGKLSLNDDITQYLPELPYKGVAIKNLLHHNSGIPDYFGLEYSIVNYFSFKKLITNDDMIKYFSVQKPKLIFKTGKKASYSNTGYVFLASIVERVSGMPFMAFMHKYIFEPAGMKNTFIYNTNNFETKIKTDTTYVKNDTSFISSNEIRINTKIHIETRIKNVERRRAYGYVHSFPYPDAYQLFDSHPFDGIFGEKGVCSSTEDLAKWNEALSTNKLVSAETLKEAYVPSDVYDRKDYYYGYGWKIYSKDLDIVFHHGLYRGFRTYLERDLENKTFVVVLSNIQIGSKMTEIIAALNRIMNNQPYKMPKPLKIQKDTLAKFLNSFKINYGGK